MVPFKSNLNPQAGPFSPSNQSHPVPVNVNFSPTSYPQGLTIRSGHIIICSLRHKTHIIEELMEQDTLDNLTVTDTWLDNSISEAVISIHCMTLFRRDRACQRNCFCLTTCNPCRKGGGVCIYVGNTVSASAETNYTNPLLELSWVRIQIGRRDNILVECLYCPPPPHLNP